MFEFIARLQQKPQRTRQRTALVCALIITGIIALVWGTTLGTRTEALETAVNEPSIFASLGRGFRGLISRVLELWSGQ